MYIGEIFEAAAKKILVIYPGRFQPWTKGHAQVYQHLCAKYGADNVFVVTSDKVDPPRSPFNFDEKRIMIAATGVDANHIVNDVQPYQPKALVANYDPTSTILIFAISEKDMAEDPRFSFKPKKDGSPGYFQPLTDIKKAQTLDKHGYITTVPTFNYEVLGQPANSATQIRAQFAAADEDTQKQIVTDLFGKFNPSILRIMQEKLGSSQVTESTITEKIIHTTQFKNFVIYVDDHYLDRSKQRNIGHKEVARVIAQFPEIEQELNEIEPGQQFWVYNQSSNVGLGMRKNMDAGGTLQLILKTVIRDTPPEQGRTPIIRL